MITKNTAMRKHVYVHSTCHIPWDKFGGDKFWQIWHIDSHLPNYNLPFCIIMRMLNGT